MTAAAPASRRSAPATTVYLTTAEVAARFRTSPSTVRYWKHIGKLTGAIRPGRKTLYPLEVVERFERQLQHDAGARHDT